MRVSGSGSGAKGLEFRVFILGLRYSCVGFMVEGVGSPGHIARRSAHRSADAVRHSALGTPEMKSNCPLDSRPEMCSSLGVKLGSSLITFRLGWTIDLYWMSCFKTNNDINSNQNKSIPKVGTNQNRRLGTNQNRKSKVNTNENRRIEG